MAQQELAVRQIISGGQTGADKTALVVAKELGLRTGGWAPRDYRTDVGSDWTLRDYGLREMPDSGYKPRTRKNVKDSDGTVWFGNVNSPGFKCTFRALQDYNKPYIINPCAAELQRWLRSTNVVILNVAGNRESTNPMICDLVRTVLMGTFKENFE